MIIQFICATVPKSTIIIAPSDGAVIFHPKVDGLKVAVQVGATSKFLVAIVPEAECIFLSLRLLLHESTYGA
jgi:hypothetical protein